MYGVSIKEDGSLDAFVDYGDNFPLSITCFDDEFQTIPSDLTGKEYTLGIEAVKGGASICEIDGVVTGNVIVFPINYSAYAGKAIEGTRYKFDYWEKTTRLTEIPLSEILFRIVAHKTDTEV